MLLDTINESIEFQLHDKISDNNENHWFFNSILQLHQDAPIAFVEASVENKGTFLIYYDKLRRFSQKSLDMRESTESSEADFFYVSAVTGII